MAKSIRKIVKINEDLCNGCGLCVPSCAEGAIRVIDGKARLVSDILCDGLGACLGECPQGALSFEEREAEAFNESAAKGHQAQPVPKAHLIGGGCPGSRTMDFRRRDAGDSESSDGTSAKPQSELRQWPVKLNLLNPSAPYLDGADLVLAADCTAFAYGSFHTDFMKGRPVAIGCPKFDGIDEYINKLTRIIDESGINSITVVIMEVPCCMGLLMAAMKASEVADHPVPLNTVVISLEGEIKSAPMLAK